MTKLLYYVIIKTKRGTFNVTSECQPLIVEVTPSLLSVYFFTANTSKVNNNKRILTKLSYYVIIKTKRGTFNVVSECQPHFRV